MKYIAIISILTLTACDSANPIVGFELDSVTATFVHDTDDGEQNYIVGGKWVPIRKSSLK